MLSPRHRLLHKIYIYIYFFKAAKWIVKWTHALNIWLINIGSLSLSKTILSTIKEKIPFAECRRPQHGKLTQQKRQLHKDENHYSITHMNEILNSQYNRRQSKQRLPDQCKTKRADQCLSHIPQLNVSK